MRTRSDEHGQRNSRENDAECDALRADKAQKLKQLMRRKPGQRGYKRSLRAYLEADATYEKTLMNRLRHAETILIS